MSNDVDVHTDISSLPNVVLLIRFTCIIPNFYTNDKDWNKKSTSSTHTVLGLQRYLELFMLWYMEPSTNAQIASLAALEKYSQREIILS